MSEITKLLEVGEVVKIILKGERPWGTIIEIKEPDIKVRIDSKLLFDYSEFEQASFTNSNFGTVKPLENLHGHTQGDEVWCVKNQYDEWVEKIRSD